MKIIFMDIDGCLNSDQEVYYHHRIRERDPLKNLKHWICLLHHRVHSKIPWRAVRDSSLYYYFRFVTDHYDFCPIACSNIQHVLDEVPEARIVVSSVWRFDGSKRLKYYLKRNGIDHTKLIGTTPTNETCSCDCERGKVSCNMTRGHQIQAWLDSHPEVKDFVIIDDDADMGEKLMPRLVQTNSRNGFIFTDAQRVITILKEGLEK